MDKCCWQIASVTDRGLVRSDNQDNFYISKDERLFVVADGMGGTKGGAIASKVAVEAMEKWWKDSNPHASEKDINEWLRDAVEDANSNIMKVAEKEAASPRMGTTIVVATQSADAHLHIAHVGDSRAILIRKDEICVLTKDHSVCMEMLLNGKLNEEQFWSSPFRHLLTRCLGHDSQVEVDTSTTPLQTGDWLILCTDGLSSVLKNDQIADIVRECSTPEEACKQLLAEVEKKGAPDNVTIIAAQYTGAGKAAEARPEASEQKAAT